MPPSTVRLAAVGDVMPARGIARAMAEHGAHYPFQRIRSEIRKADLAICNLEGVLSGRGMPQHPSLLFRGDRTFAASLAWAGFTHAIVANNHSFDFGPAALLDTLDNLRERNVTPVGGGKGASEAKTPTVCMRKGVKIGFLAYTDVLNTSEPSSGPTMAVLHESDFADEVRRAKHQCDTLVLVMHWGIEYAPLPSQRQVTLAHLAIDAGADLVLGSHPHVLQTVERYKSATVVYSMGNFIFDSRRKNSDRSAIFLFDISKGKAALVAIRPAQIVHRQPRLRSVTIPKGG